MVFRGSDEARAAIAPAAKETPAANHHHRRQTKYQRHEPRADQANMS